MEGRRDSQQEWVSERLCQFYQSESRLQDYCFVRGSTPYVVGPFIFGDNVVTTGGQFKACATNLATKAFRCNWN